MTQKIVTAAEVYAHLICEFNHYDCCLVGLVEIDGHKMLAKITADPAEFGDETRTYTLREIDWNSECDAYLADYRVACKHWFHEGKPRCNYDGRPLGWFSDKWQKRNPIRERAVK